MVCTLGREEGPIDFSMYGLTKAENPLPLDQAIAILKTNFDNGIRDWSGGIHYGTPNWNSRHLLEAYCNWDSTPIWPLIHVIDWCINEMHGITNRKKYINIFIPTGLDQSVDIPTLGYQLRWHENTADFRGAGLCDVDALTLCVVSEVFKIDVVEVEISLLTPGALSNGLLKTCKEYELPIIATAPLPRLAHRHPSIH